MALPDVPTRSPLRGEVPTLVAFEDLSALVAELAQRVAALESPGSLFPGPDLLPGTGLYPKAG